MTMAPARAPSMSQKVQQTNPLAYARTQDYFESQKLTTLQRGFYIALAVAPVSYLAYTLATDDKNFVRRYLDQYQSQRELDAHRNNLHTQMMEEAVQDRSLFKYSPRDVSGPDLRYPE